MSAPLNAYEAERASKIAANRRQLEALGLLQLGKAIRTVEAPAAARNVATPAKRPAQATTPSRASARIGASERVCYAEAPEPALGGAGERRAPRAARVVLDAVWRGFAASPEAAAAAFDAAVDDAAERVDAAVFIKQMMPSIISGGFWFSLPCATLPDSVVAAVDQDAAKSTVWLEDADGVLFPCVWLKRPTGAGLSGGWRGFAIAHALNTADALVFEHVTAGGGAASPLRLRVTIHRAQAPTAEQARPCVRVCAACVLCIQCVAGVLTRVVLPLFAPRS
jgi:hypothetical protein